jgi:hypothetical protein
VPWKWGRGLVLLALVAIVLEAGRGEGLSVRLGLLMAFGLGSFGIDAHDLLRSASPWLRRLRGRPAL